MTKLNPGQRKNFLNLILISGLIFLFSWLYFLFTPVITNEMGFKYTIPEGASIRTVTQNLYDLKIIKQPIYFRFLVFLKGNNNDLKAGEYLFPKGTTPLHLVSQIMTGKGMLYYPVTIVEGWTFKQLRENLAAQQNLKQTINKLSDADIMKSMDSATLDPEGRFFPDTYYYIKGSTDLALLKRAYKLMQRKLNAAWKARDVSIPFHSQDEALTAASLVEKEAYIDQEKPIIAGVLINRIEKKMLLQFDPTVIFALGEHYQGKITKEDLQWNNPYNTYIFKGLPPGPIAIPGLKSIMAVMHPAHHEFYYFVAKGKGAHAFTKTLPEHNAAVLQAKEYRPMQFNVDLARYYFLATEHSPLIKKNAVKIIN